MSQHHHFHHRNGQPAAELPVDGVLSFTASAPRRTHIPRADAHNAAPPIRHADGAAFPSGQESIHRRCRPSGDTRRSTHDRGLAGRSASPRWHVADGSVLSLHLHRPSPSAGRAPTTYLQRSCAFWCFLHPFYLHRHSQGKHSLTRVSMMERYNGFKGWPTSRNDGIARTSLTDNRCASFRPGDDFMIAHDRPRSLRTPEPRGIRSVVRLQDAPRNPANRARANAQQLRDSGLAICIKAGDRDFLNAHDGTAFIRLQCSRRRGGRNKRD